MKKNEFGKSMKKKQQKKKEKRKNYCQLREGNIKKENGANIKILIREREKERRGEIREEE